MFHVKSPQTQESGGSSLRPVLLPFCDGLQICQLVSSRSLVGKLTHISKHFFQSLPLACLLQFPRMAPKVEHATTLQGPG